MTNPWLKPRHLPFAVAALIVTGALSTSVPGSAQNCSEGTPAFAANAQLWGSLRPGDIDLQGHPAQLPDDRDSTDYTGNNLPNQFRPLFSSVEAENGYVFTSYADGFRIWDVHGGNAELPSMISAGDIRSGAGCSASGFWIVTPACTELKQFFWDIDTPPGRDDIFAMSGIAGIGLSIIDATNKQQPSLYYQEEGKGSTPQGSEVFVDTINGRDYAFLAANSGTTTQGVFLYDMTAARALGRCGENTSETIQCPGVYKGRIGPGVSAVYLDGVTTSSGKHLLAVSSGGFSQSDKGIQIWDVSNPSSPVNLESSGSAGRLLTNQINYGVALWEQSSHQYLAVNVGTGAQIYDITSCVSAGGCSSLGSPIWSGNWTQWGQAPQGADRFYATFSRSNGRPMLYFASNDQCSGGRQREFLFDASSASAPVEITPRSTISVAGRAVDYWSWYYSGNSHLGDPNFVPGFSRVAPSRGKFLGNVFYRSAQTIFDAHVWTNATPQPPTANFDFSPATDIYAGTPVTFTDTSTGTETSRLWTFPADASTTSSTASPVVVSFSTEGSKSVTLEAINSLGSTTKTKTFTVLNPAPSIGGVAHAPAGTPLTCQSVTFTASGMTGSPAPTLSWVVKDGSNSQVYPLSGSVLGNPFVLPAQALGAGSYSAVASGTNGHPPDAVVSHAFSLAAPSAITFDGPGGAPVCTNCTSGSPPFGTVTLDASTSGATEYSWDFGDGIFRGYANGDQTYNIPNPSFTYTSQGPRSVRVKVRNCAGNELVSQTLTVTINQIQALTIDVFEAQCPFGVCSFSAGAITFDVQVTGGADRYEYDWTGQGLIWDTTTGPPVNGTVSHVYAAGNFVPKIRVKRGAEPYVGPQSAPSIHVDSSTPPPPPPPVSITVTGSGGQINQALTFNATANNCTPVTGAWTWNTGGGTGSSTSGSIQITWSTSGTKTVTASNSGCSASGSTSVVITDPASAPLVASYTSSPANPKTGDTIIFDGTGSQGGATGWAWDLGGGLIKTGSTVTYSFATAGTYPVKLEVSKPGSGANCSLGLCTASITKQIVVSPSTPPPPPLVASFETTPACEGGFGAELCTATTGQTVEFRSTSTGDPTGLTWSFSDGPLVGVANTTHAWSTAGVYAVRLTITRGSDTAFAQKTFTVSPPPAPLGKVAIIPWVIQNNNADVELSDLYLYNPGPQDTHLTLTYHNRGIPSPNPPTMQRTLVAGATLQVLALLGQFHVDNTSGFISVLASQGDPQPMMVGFHQSFDGNKRFGQVLPGFSLGSPTSGPAVYHLVGLHDTTDRGTTFGATNADYSAAHYSLRFFDKDGTELGSRPSTALAGNSQEQLDRAAQQALGVNNDADYRIEVEVADGGNFFPFADVRWASSDDAGLLTARREGGRPRQYLLGMFNGASAKSTKFSADAVLVNPTDQPMVVTLSFVSSLGKVKAVAPRTKTLQAGQTLRVADVLNSEFRLKTGAGVVVVDSAGVGGVYPVVVGDTYNTAGTSRFGQLVPSVDDRDVATAGRTQVLIGLQEDNLYKSTMWFHNPAGAPASAELTFRKLDGTVLNRLVVNVGAGKAMQVPARVNKGLPKSYSGAFTVEVKVNAGQLYSGAQVINKGTNDPSFNLGQLRP